MKITFADSALPKGGVLVVGVLEEREPTPSARALDAALGGRLSRAMAAGPFKGRKSQKLELVAPAESEFDRVVLLGMGKAADIDLLAMEAWGARAYVALSNIGQDKAAVMVDALDGVALGAAEMAAATATGARLRSYRFSKYQTRKTDDDEPTLSSLTIGTPEAAAARKLYEPAARVADGVELCRNLVSEPANVIYPESFAEEARKLADLGVDVEVLGETEMKKLGMNTLLAVGQGSARDSRLVVMRWNGVANADDKSKKAKDGKKKKKQNNPDAEGPIAFIGKGVTFDSGGISIKPSAGMEEMKYDMAGAGAVIGLIKALAGRNAQVDAVGIVGLVENMPSGNAQRPGDVVTSMSGQTVEVINTDAEGRLVLADALWYTNDRFKPRVMIDLATLTGAIVISLGEQRAGLFSNDDGLAEHITAAGEAVGEPVCGMPLGEAYDEMIKSDIADMKNVGNRSAGSITAAQFLKRFVGETPWAHLDIAGMAWAKKDKPVVPKGASGYGVRLLDRFIADHYEAK